jgi:DNA modification methylase
VPNKLYCGDNLEILRDYIRTESVDLVYLDPPFNSQQDYNVIFRDKSGKRSTSQELAFGDTWEWSSKAEETCRELVEAGGPLSQVIQAFRTFVGDSDMMAYLAMMAPRLIELHRVLRPSGSIYLHCDPTASHYLKMLMDAIFGPSNFLNEIVWKRTGAHNSARRYGPLHDTLLFYSKSDAYKWAPQYQSQDEYIKKRYTYVDEKGRRFYPVSLIAAGVRHGSSGQPWKGIDVSARGNHWRYSLENLEKLDKNGDIYWPPKGGKPRLKMYADNAKGAMMQDWWGDIAALNSQAQERVGYPTQKPQSLLERIILSSSEAGDVVLDPFCGCGTAVAAAQKLDRQWIGIDITHLAIAIIKQRLVNNFGFQVFRSVKVVGEPVNEDEAAALATDDKFGFQCWVVGKLGAPPIEHRRGADRGIDGRLYFHDDHGTPKEIVISVKAGERIGPAFVRELRGVLERERAEMGILACVKAPTQEMLLEAKRAGTYRSLNGVFPRLQIITLADIFANKPLNIPGRLNPYERKKPASATTPVAEQLRLLP